MLLVSGKAAAPVAHLDDVFVEQEENVLGFSLGVPGEEVVPNGRPVGLASRRACSQEHPFNKLFHLHVRGPQSCYHPNPLTALSRKLQGRRRGHIMHWTHDSRPGFDSLSAPQTIVAAGDVVDDVEQLRQQPSCRWWAQAVTPGDSRPGPSAIRARCSCARGPRCLADQAQARRGAPRAARWSGGVRTGTDPDGKNQPSKKWKNDVDTCTTVSHPGEISSAQAATRGGYGSPGDSGCSAMEMGGCVAGTKLRTGQDGAADAHASVCGRPAAFPVPTRAAGGAAQHSTAQQAALRQGL